MVRHARAGKRNSFEGDDRLRPLDEKGWRQARALTELFAGFEIRRIVSSAYVRCMQTVEPSAHVFQLPIEERSELEEGATRKATLALLRELDDAAVACTHGDVLENLFGEAGQKGSTRVVELSDDEPMVLEHLPPPA